MLEAENWAPIRLARQPWRCVFAARGRAGAAAGRMALAIRRRPRARLDRM